MVGGKSGRVFGIDFGRAVGRSAAANGIDDVLGTEAGKFHDGPSNLALRNAARPGCNGGTNAAADSSDVRWEGKFGKTAATSRENRGTNTVAGRSDGHRARKLGKESGKGATMFGDENR